MALQAAVALPRFQPSLGSLLRTRPGSSAILRRKRSQTFALPMLTMAHSAATCSMTEREEKRLFEESSHVLIHTHKPTSQSKRRSIINGGLENLHVVLDFDHTLTAYLCPSGSGERCHECHDVLQHGPYQPKERRETFRAGIEKVWSDQLAGRLGDLSEWWIRFHNEIVAHRITRDEIRDAVVASNAVLRPGAAQLLDWLRRHDVKTTIVSAGVSTVIEEVLGREGIDLHRNVRIVANVPIFDAEGVVLGFEEPLIFSRNKSEVLRGMGFDSEEDDNRRRHNIVLAGNSVGDASCLDGMDHKHSLSFGFLHEEVREEWAIGEICASKLSIQITGDGESSEDLAEHPLTDDGKIKLKEFSNCYDVISCGYQSDFQFLMNLFQEMEEQHKMNKVGLPC